MAAQAWRDDSLRYHLACAVEEAQGQLACFVDSCPESNGTFKYTKRDSIETWCDWFAKDELPTGYWEQNLTHVQNLDEKTIVSVADLLALSISCLQVATTFHTRRTSRRSSPTQRAPTSSCSRNTFSRLYDTCNANVIATSTIWCTTIRMTPIGLSLLSCLGIRLCSTTSLGGAPATGVGRQLTRLVGIPFGKTS